MKNTPPAARTKLAMMIQQKLGYGIRKNPRRSGQDEAYGPQSPVKPDYEFDHESTLEERAEKRERLLKLRQQYNIESIMTLAMHYCPDVANEGQPDPDWVERFINLAEDTSNHSMQQLWAKILAGETMQPGTFSIKSLQTLKQMTQREADALQKATALCGYNDQDHSNLILLGYYRRPTLFELLRKSSNEQINLSRAGLGFPQILTLMDTALLYRKEIESAPFKHGQELKIRYMGQNLLLKAKTSDLVLSYYKFTQTGDELRKLIRRPLNRSYQQLVSSALQRDFEVSWQPT